MPYLKSFISTIVLSGSLIQLHHADPRRVYPDPSVLSETLQSFHVQNATMEEALRTLRQSDFARILIGFEKIPHRVGERTESLSLSISNATIGQALDQLCQQSPNYTYEIIDRTIIHVHPARVQSDLPGLLNIRIKDFSVEEKMSIAAIIPRIGEFAPELASYLRDKQSEFYSSRGTAPASPGATMHGNMDPEVSLHLYNLTVREILNATVIYSRRLRDKTPADWTGNKLPTASWMYEFVIDPNAPTGLGGIPQWTAF